MQDVSSYVLLVKALDWVGHIFFRQIQEKPYRKIQGLYRLQKILFTREDTFLFRRFFLKKVPYTRDFIHIKNNTNP